eukprot:gene9468-9548_t
MSNETIRRMRRVPFLNNLSTDALRLLSFSGETQILRANDVLFEAGTVSKGGFLLLQGAILLEQNGQPVQRVEMDSLIGELALLTQTIHPATAVAATACTLLHMSRTLFARVLQEFPEDAMALRKVITDKTEALNADLGKLKTRFSA